MKKVLFYTAIGLLFLNKLNAQEVLTGLKSNIQKTSVLQSETIQQQKSVDKIIAYPSLLIPFSDDFSTQGIYPDTALWIDNHVFINQSFGINPPTIGVATLDAVDAYGKIYEHARQTAFPADTLSSRPIRLDSIFSPFPKDLTVDDSLYFSFFYQPGGGIIGKPWSKLGDAPEKNDSLILEFGYYTGDTILAYYTKMLYITDTVFSVGDTIYSLCDPNLFVIVTKDYEKGDTIYLPCDSVLMVETKWEKIWATEGMVLDTFIHRYNLDTNKLLFRQVFIPITDSVFFNQGFQFRFRNYASLEYTENNPTWASNVDCWNIDYVRLDRARTIANTDIDDVAFSENPGSVLKNYQSMPWSQFKNNQGAETRKEFKIKLSNLSYVVKNTYYDYFITDKNNQIIHNYSGGSYNISPVHDVGFQTYQPHASPPFSFTFPSDNNDSAVFNLIHVFREAGSGDKNANNDTAIFQQKFYNYYAYDDGTPESGYTVINPYSHRTAMAMRFTLNHEDTLRAIAMYINHVLDDANDFQFTLSVWADSSNLPGKELYSELITQEYSNELYGFQQYYLQEAVPISGKFYIGYQIDTKNYLNVGFDQNNNSSEHVFYKIDNFWTNSFLSGTPMLRPFVGKAWIPTSIENTSPEHRFDVTLYPNPVNDKLRILLSNSVEQSDIHIEIYSINGQKIYSHPFTQDIDVSNYKSGFYILKTYHKQTKETRLNKFIINH